MSGLDTIKTIVDAEKAAKKVLEDARLKSQQMKSQLQEKVESQYNTIVEDARKQSELVKGKAEEEAKHEAAKLLDESRSRLTQLEKDATKNREKAVKFIVDLVLGRA